MNVRKRPREKRDQVSRTNMSSFVFRSQLFVSEEPQYTMKNEQYICMLRMMFFFIKILI